MNFDEWAPIERRIRAAFPGFAPDAESQDVYLDVLSDVDATAVERAVNELLREGHTAPPPPGVIRSRALGLDSAPSSAPPAPATADTRDHGARRGLGWVGVVAAGALAVAVVAIVVALVNENDDGSVTSPNVTVTQETPAVTQETPAVTVERPSVTVAPPAAGTTP